MHQLNFFLKLNKSCPGCGFQINTPIFNYKKKEAFYECLNCKKRYFLKSSKLFFVVYVLISTAFTVMLFTKRGLNIQSNALFILYAFIIIAGAFLIGSYYEKLVER